MYRKILVPLDGSEMANVALNYAGGAISQMGGVELNLLHIYNPGESGLAAMHRAYIERSIETVNSRIEEMRQKAGMPMNAGGVSVRGESLMGYPVETINEYISSNGIDLILMPTHGRSGLNRLVMGSVANEVLLASEAPVWLVRAGISREALDRRLPIRQILVPLDGSKLAESVLPHVEKLAKQCGAGQVEVVLLRVCEPTLVESGYPPVKVPGIRSIMSADWEEPRRKEMLREMSATRAYLYKAGERLKGKGLNVRTDILTGDPALKIIDYLGKNIFSVIAMATHGRSGIGRLAYGSVAEQIMLKASTPFFLVRPQHSNAR